MASILSFTNRLFRTRSPDRDASTDRDRMMNVRAAVVAAIESATRERDGLKQRVDDYYAAAGHILDQAEFGERSARDEQAIVEAERHGGAGLRRIVAINEQLQRLNSVLDFVDEQDAGDVLEATRA